MQNKFRSSFIESSTGKIKDETDYQTKFHQNRTNGDDKCCHLVLATHIKVSCTARAFPRYNRLSKDFCKFFMSELQKSTRLQLLCKNSMYCTSIREPSYVNAFKADKDVLKVKKLTTDI